MQREAFSLHCNGQNERYGSHIHTLDWALHLDENTPHIHERHVFDVRNRYGERQPKQEQALKELGFEEEPIYGGKKYKEKRNMSLIS